MNHEYFFWYRVLRYLAGFWLHKQGEQLGTSRTPLISIESFNKVPARGLEYWIARIQVANENSEAKAAVKFSEHRPRLGSDDDEGVKKTCKATPLTGTKLNQ
ncbi:hypothetical protein FALCPG4_015598 [Fusarium falciforme]